MFQLYGSFSYWAWSGTVYLIFMYFLSVRKKPFKERYNYLMFGITFSLLSHIKRNIWYILALVVIMLIVAHYLHKFKIFKPNEVATFMWTFYGFGIISIYNILYFLVAILLLALFTYGIGKLTKIEEYSNYSIILLSFWLISFLFSLY